MLKRELKYNLKSFIIWNVIILGMLLVVFLIYPTIANSDTVQSMDEMMKAFPKELLEAFNMDLASMTTMYGWLKTEGLVYLLLIVGSYAGILGSNILLKEENDKTIEYLNSLPIKRSKIVISKFVTGIIYVILMILILAIFDYIGLTLSGDFDTKEYLLLCITPIFPSIVIYSLCMFISTFAHKTKTIIGVSLGVVFISYIFNAISGITDSVEFLKYFSCFTLADIRNILINKQLSIICIILSIVITIVLLFLTKLRYEKKDLI